jgi:hypothetical protein
MIGYLLQLSYKFLTTGKTTRRKVMVVGEKLPTSSTIIGLQGATSTKQVTSLQFCRICYSGIAHSFAGFREKHPNHWI